MEKTKLMMVVGFIILMATMSLPGCARGARDGQYVRRDPATIPASERFGGVLRTSQNTDPVSLDPHIESGESEQIPMAHIFETVISLDRQGNPFPCVTTFEFDGTTLRLRVRDGLIFHNGDPVTIYDVDASLTRWLANVSFARNHFGNRIGSRAIEGDELVITFNRPAPLALTAAGRYAQGWYVMPRAIAEAFPTTRLPNEYLIGTGPYRFVRHMTGRYVLVERFDGYIRTNNVANGRAAPKMAYADQIFFFPVPDRTARIMGVQTNEFDVAIGVPANMIDELSRDPNLEIEIENLGIMASMLFNSHQGPATCIYLRRAILLTLDMYELMLAAQGHSSLFFLHPSIMDINSRWWNDIGLERYETRDLDRARAYLARSTYNGEVLRFITTTDFDYFFRTAMVVAENARAIGINIDVQVFDNPTLRQFRSDPTRFEMFSGGLGPYVDPALVPYLDPSWPTRWNSPRKEEAVTRLNAVTDFETRLAIWKEISEIMHDELPVITFGERRNPVVFRNNVYNLFTAIEKTYWNTFIIQ